jgi:hypothetical protein
MWRPFEENCEEEEMVDVETMFDNNEENIDKGVYLMQNYNNGTCNFYSRTEKET